MSKEGITVRDVIDVVVPRAVVVGAAALGMSRLIDDPLQASEIMLGVIGCGMAQMGRADWIESEAYLRNAEEINNAQSYNPIWRKGRALFHKYRNMPVPSGTTVAAMGGVLTGLAIAESHGSVVQMALMAGTALGLYCLGNLSYRAGVNLVDGSITRESILQETIKESGSIHV